MGNSNVGKSNLSFRFLKNEFYEYQQPTIGIDYQTKVVRVEGKVVSVKLWDTAGQERYYSMV